MIYNISANGFFMGSYEADTEDEAILAYVRDAGYESIEQAAAVCGKSPEEFRAEITIEV